MCMSDDIVAEILLRLPVKSTMKFRCVCKSWYEFLTHNDFVKNHLKRSIEKNNPMLVFTTTTSGVYSMDYDHPSSPTEMFIQNRIDFPLQKYMSLTVIQIFGSCNGLLLVNIIGNMVLWNPATREYKIIPSSETANGVVRNYGFGYDRLSSEYKLVKIESPYSFDDDDPMVPCSYEHVVSRVQVYSLSSNSWRRIDCIPYKIGDELIKGVFFHEAIHWLANPCPIRSNNNKFSQVLLSFSMAKEVFYELPLLEFFDDNDKFKDKRIDVLEDCLCMLGSHSGVGFEVWVMKDYGVGDSWTKRYTISRSEFENLFPSFWCLRRIQLLKNAEILLEIQVENGFRDAAVILYDPKHKRAKLVEIDIGNYEVWRNYCGLSTGRLTSRFCTETCVESLVSLHSGTYVGGEQEKSDFAYVSRR